MERIDGAGQMADTVSRFPGFCLLDYASFASGISVFGAHSVYSYARLFGSLDVHDDLGEPSGKSRFTAIL